MKKIIQRIKDYITEARCQGYEICLKDTIIQFEKIQDLDPQKVREEVRRFVRMYKSTID